MRLDKKREAALMKRQGAARKTVIQTIWLVISAVIAYFLCTLVIFSPENGLLTYNEVYRVVGIPPAVPQWAILVAFILLIVIVMQFFLLIGFAFSSSEGRRRPGTPSLHSRNKDPLDNKFD